MPDERFRKLTDLQKIVGYRFQDESLLKQALIHRSHVNEEKGLGDGDNERLEFLGDAVLQLTITDYLIRNFPGINEGELSKKRSALVREEALAVAAENLKIGRYLKLGKGEELTGGRKKPSILAGALDAIIGAVYLDAGYDVAREKISGWLEKFLKADVDEEIFHADYKSRLQELSQSLYQQSPDYLIISETGPDHHKLFKVGVRLKGQFCGFGRGYSKKEAEQNAARDALVGLEASLSKQKI